MNLNVNMTKKDLFNAKNGSISIDDAIDHGEALTVTGCAVLENSGTDKQGNPCDVGYIATNIGVVGFTSNVCLKGMEEFADYLTDCINDNTPVQIEFFAGQSKNGSEYKNFKIV